MALALGLPAGGGVAAWGVKLAVFTQQETPHEHSDR